MPPSHSLYRPMLRKENFSIHLIFTHTRTRTHAYMYTHTHTCTRQRNCINWSRWDHSRPTPNPLSPPMIHADGNIYYLFAITPNLLIKKILERFCFDIVCEKWKLMGVFKYWGYAPHPSPLPQTPPVACARMNCFFSLKTRVAWKTHSSTRTQKP